MSRVYNFSAGPAVLPEEVLKEAAAEMLDYQGCGMSVMEMSHRSSVFQEIIETAEADIRELMHIPDNYKVLFLQGGASQQFAMIPMNLMKNKVADYIVTGQWATIGHTLSSLSIWQSITTGCPLFNAFANASLNSSWVATRTPSAPIASASFTKSTASLSTVAE